MFINPIILGVAATIGGECVLICLVLAVTVVRYIRHNRLTLTSILRAVQSFATVWGENQSEKGN